MTNTKRMLAPQT